MMLHFNAVGTLQTVIECPTCGKTGEETMFTECCCKYVLSLLGIHSIQRNSKCPLCGLALRSDEDETGYCRTYAVHTDLKRRHLKNKDGYCYAYEDDTQESCKYYLPYRVAFTAAFTDGANWECQHHRLDGRCAA